jgi:hypothetical protein
MRREESAIPIAADHPPIAAEPMMERRPATRQLFLARSKADNLERTRERRKAQFWLLLEDEHAF